MRNRLKLAFIIFSLPLVLNAEVVTDALLFKTATKLLEQENYVISRLEISDAAKPYRTFPGGLRLVLGRGKLYWKLEFDEMSKRIPVHYSCLIAKESLESNIFVITACDLEIRDENGSNGGVVDIAKGS